MEVGQSGRRIAVIPARGGSKRIPRKNITDFMGKPMIAWSIEAALQSNAIDEVFVSTDDLEIAELAKDWGASVPFLRKQYADDHSPVSLATLEFVERLGIDFELNCVVQLMANCPLRRAETINKAIRFFESDASRSSVISAMPYGMFNPWWAHQCDDEGHGTPLFKAHISNARSQDLTKLMCPTGSIWISTGTNLKNSQSFYSKNYRLFDVGWKEGVDIDDFEDLEFAKSVFQLEKNR